MRETIFDDNNEIKNKQTNTCTHVKCVMGLWYTSLPTTLLTDERQCWLNVYIICFSIKNLAKIKLQFIEKKT